MSVVIGQNQRLPNWTLEETLLAWDLYLRQYADPLRYPDASHPEVQQLSRHLRSLAIHPAQVRRSPRFRNPSGVARKVQNLMYFDTEGKAGSENGSAVDEQVASGTRDLSEVGELAARVRNGSRLGSSDLGERGPRGSAERVSTSRYIEALDALDGSLDMTVLQTRRVEQRYLRQSLFGDATVAACAICGRDLPVELLVAAHIKARATCTREEKLDIKNVVMAACSLGCDSLYERGYIAVNASGVVMAASVALPSSVVESIQSLEGRICSAFSDGSAAYFAVHRSEVFLDRR